MAAAGCPVDRVNDRMQLLQDQVRRQALIRHPARVDRPRECQAHVTASSVDMRVGLGDLTQDVRHALDPGDRDPIPSDIVIWPSIR